MFNETMWHSEKQVFRAVTGSSYNIPGAYGIMTYGSVFPAKGTIPISTPKAGTIISQGVNVRGSGTTFTTSCQNEDFIHANGVVRKIDYIVSDTLLVLTEGFPNDITSAHGLRVCSPQIYKSIYAKSTDTNANAVLQEATFVSGEVSFTGGAPISYDATTGQISFEVTRWKTMEALIGFLLLCVLWLTYLTHRSRQQSLENKKLQNRNRYYIKEIKRITSRFNPHSDGKEDEEAETE